MGNDLVSFEGVEDFFSAIEIIKGCKIGKSDDSVQMTDDSLSVY